MIGHGADHAAGVLPLYPQAGPARPLRDLYLAHDLRAAAGDATLIYANFIASLDGRVALPDTRGVLGVPAAIANPRDWRLFQELAVQADAVLVSGRYLRARARGEAQDLFAAFRADADAGLRAWRGARGLPAWPRIAVLSRTLDFAPPEDIAPERLLVLTGDAGAGSPAARDLRARGATVLAMASGVRGLRAALSAAGCRLVYAVGGPRVLHALAASRALDRLYLSLAPALLGGERLATLVEGVPLEPPTRLRLHTLYYDLTSDAVGAGQLFGCYSVA